MCSDKKIVRAVLPGAKVLLAIVMLTVLAASCAIDRKVTGVKEGTIRAELSIPSDAEYEKAREELIGRVLVDTAASGHTDGPIILNAIRDDVTGEMVATDVISASKVVARFRNVAERFGKVQLGFDITVPKVMLESQWKLKFSPLMRMMGDSTALDPIYITGQKYRDEQMRGYNRYARFLASIITDSTDFVRLRQLEIFIKRYYPETYSMKNDTSFVPDPVAENIFGVTQREALIHYTRHGMIERNQKRKADRDKMFRKYVKDPFVAGGIRLDTVIATSSGDLVYRYVQEVGSRPGLKRIDIALDGSLYERGREVSRIGRPEELTFYVSSLSSLADMTPRFVMKILERKVYDNTHAFIDFHQGKADIDTLLPGNASELARIRRAVGDVMARKELVLDSLFVTASCSPEGGYEYNRELSKARAETVKRFLGGVLDEETSVLLRSDCIPENWEQLARIVENDTLLSKATKKKLSEWMLIEDKDAVEMMMASLPEYRYLREKVYPKLRSVRFDFYLHRRGMLKDTIHTTEVDTIYMKGVEALKDLDYKRAVELLRPYHDYNTALAYLSAGYNHSALADLEGLPSPSARSEYLMAIALSRLDRRKESMEAYMRSVELDPSMIHRANLDPELSEFVNNFL